MKIITITNTETLELLAEKGFSFTALEVEYQMWESEDCIEPNIHSIQDDGEEIDNKVYDQIEDILIKWHIFN